MTYKQSCAILMPHFQRLQILMDIVCSITQGGNFFIECRPRHPPYVVA